MEKEKVMKFLILLCIIQGTLFIVIFSFVYATGIYSNFVEERTGNPNQFDEMINFPVGGSIVILPFAGLIFIGLGFYMFKDLRELEKIKVKGGKK